MAFGTLKADTLTHSTAGSLATNFVVEGSAKAWCKFGNDAQPDDSLNISSGTDVGTGQWRFAKTNAMSTSNYVVVGISGNVIDNFNTGHNSNALESTTNHTQSKFNISGSAFTDFNSGGYGMHSAHGDLA